MAYSYTIFSYIQRKVMQEIQPIRQYYIYASAKGIYFSFPHLFTS
jgi:hypothetical protein